MRHFLTVVLSVVLSCLVSRSASAATFVDDGCQVDFVLTTAPASAGYSFTFLLTVTNSTMDDRQVYRNFSRALLIPSAPPLVIAGMQLFAYDTMPADDSLLLSIRGGTSRDFFGAVNMSGFDDVSLSDLVFTEMFRYALIPSPAITVPFGLAGLVALRRRR